MGKTRETVTLTQANVQIAKKGTDKLLRPLRRAPCRVDKKGLEKVRIKSIF